MNIITKRYKNGLALEFPEYYEEFHQNGWYEHSELESQDWIIDNAQPDWHSFDVGSHIGYYSLLLSWLCPEGQVTAFDPCRETNLMMDCNVLHNALKYQRPFEIARVEAAVGNQVGPATETVWQTGKTPGNYGKTTGIFNFISLDFYCAINRINRLDFIKIDCDGWDYDVMLGAKTTLESLRPAVLAEANYALGWRNHNGQQMVDFMKPLGYKHQWLDAGAPGNLLFTLE
jgi:FkbM family methyltransferase